MSDHTWVRHAVHGGYWQCPTEVLDEYRAKGWEPSDPPEEPNPAVAEMLAAREAAAKTAETTKPTKAAPRGKSEE
ncbi:hypothetical protein ABGB07_02340 [Micromonosporaceae bacterium B7E4]